jgi:hypothetical protein
VVALVAAAGCASSGAEDAGSPTTEAAMITTTTLPSAADLTRAAVAYHVAMLAGDGAASYGYLTDACRAEVTEADWATGAADYRAGVRASLGPGADSVRVANLSTTEVGPIQGDVLVTFATDDDPDPFGWGVPFRQHWYVEGGRWHTDGCSDGLSADGAAEAARPVEVVAFGFDVLPGGDDRWATNQAVVVQNPNPDLMAIDVRVVVRLYDADGELLATDDQTLVDIWPGTAGALSGVVDAPGAVRMEVDADAGRWEPAEGPLGLDVGPIERVPEPADDHLGEVPGTWLNGEVTNTSPVDQGVGVTIVFVDPAGQVRGGTSALGMVLPTVPAGGRGPIATHTPRQLPDDWTLQTYLTPLAPQDPPTFD